MKNKKGRIEELKWRIELLEDEAVAMGIPLYNNAEVTKLMGELEKIKSGKAERRQ